MGDGRGRYKTKQRETILSFLEETDQEHVTVDEIVKHLKGRVGQTTIYRHLDDLVMAGVVLKYENPSGLGACYRYIGNETKKEEEDPYHFLCVGCGRMMHLVCERFNDLSLHVEKDHGITLDKQRTVLYGSCESCKDKNNSQTR